MKDEGKSISESMQKWMYIFTIVTIAGPIGYILAKPLPYEYLSIMIGFAAGSLIAFLAEDLIPESYKKSEMAHRAFYCFWIFNWYYVISLFVINHFFPLDTHDNIL